MAKNLGFVKNRVKNAKTSAKQYHWLEIRKYLGSHRIYSNPVQSLCPAKFAFEALHELGTNQWHHIDAVAEKTIGIMSSVSSIDELSQWDAYCARVTKKDIDPYERLSFLISRLSHSYRDILAGMGCSLDLKKKDRDKYLRLNTRGLLKSSENSSAKVTKRSAFHRFYRMAYSMLTLFKH